MSDEKELTPEEVLGIARAEHDHAVAMVPRDDSWVDVTASDVAYQLIAAMQQERRMRESINLLIGYALTSRSHSKEWLEGMAERINHTAELLGDTDRAVAQRDHLIIKRGDQPYDEPVTAKENP